MHICPIDFSIDELMTLIKALETKRDIERMKRPNFPFGEKSSLEYAYRYSIQETHWAEILNKLYKYKDEISSITEDMGR